ncbi:MAG: hypothetical protein ACRDS0_16080 [Pseudonocardiaceae bacterium]
MTALRRSGRNIISSRNVSGRNVSGRALRGLSGVLAGGLVALAIVLCLAQWLGATRGFPGPGRSAVVGHLVAALAAIALQVAAERCRGRTAALASWSVLLLAAVVLWFGWLS